MVHTCSSASLMPSAHTWFDTSFMRAASSVCSASVKDAAPISSCAGASVLTRFAAIVHLKTDKLYTGAR